MKRVKNAPHFKKGELHGNAKRAVEKRTATEAPAVTVTNETPTVTSASQARDDLKVLATSLPEGSQQRTSIELMIARDEARETHSRDEKALQTSDPTARLPRPTILRDPSEEAGRHLNNEMDRLIFAAGSSARSEREALPKEAQAVHDALTGLEERREKAAQKPTPSAHRSGSQPWACLACGQRFHSGTMDEVRKWNRDDPTWRFNCPECHSQKVQIIEVKVA